jgi:hypothetical protein
MKKLLLLVLSPLASLMLTTGSGFAAETRCFELRTYYAAPGKLDELHARFRDHTMKIFEKHGMSNIGYWTPIENPDRKLIYLLAFPSREAQATAWKEFGSDPEWQSVQKATEAKGRLVTKVESKLLSATDYSPSVHALDSSESHVYELRTYTASSGHLEDLNARFRDHTMALFKKHGMTSFGYWVPMKGQKGAEETLIYILAHPSQKAAQAAFKSFGGDPDWVAAKKASEEKAGGSLTVKDGVQSVFMQPTDYSPAK